MKILIMVFVILLVSFPKIVFAQQNNLTTNQFITVINPVRISSYSTNPKASLEAQYLEVKKRNLAATWLFNYDVFSSSELAEVAKSMDKFQELGLLLEVTPKFASEAGVIYNKTDSWHRANSVFLSGYIQEDRRKLIDKAFEKFKIVFGFYPISIGAWWIDSYSLEYMKNRYNITANLTVADQFATDGYQVWGQYWSVPFYPSKIHAGIPASTPDSKLDIVTIQWAARDPLNGYGRKEASLFSTQDYMKIDYFQKLVELYAKSHNNKFGQITVGLEGDFPPETYAGFFADQLDVVKKEKDSGAIDVVTMQDFSNWYRSNFPLVSPAYTITTDDFLGKKIKTFWYQSSSFRINITYDQDTEETKVRDFRTYSNSFQEPYLVSPNRDLNLSINLPSQIDSAGNPDEEWAFFKDQLENVESGNEKITLKYKKHSVKITKEKIEIVGDVKNIPNSLSKSPLIDIKKTANGINLVPKFNWNFPERGLIFRSLTQEATHFLKQRKIILSAGLIILFFFLTTFFVSKRKIPPSLKIVIIGGMVLVLIGGILKWYFSNSRLYFVNHAELDGLNRLKTLSGRKIVVYDKTCLQCSWHTEYMPAIFANRRDYVRKVTGKDIVYNFSVFNAKTRPEAKHELDKLNADYIYVVRFEDYREEVPFSPGDLNIEEIYANANAQIWKVKK